MLGHQYLDETKSTTTTSELTAYSLRRNAMETKKLGIVHQRWQSDGAQEVIDKMPVGIENDEITKATDIYLHLPSQSCVPIAYYNIVLLVMTQHDRDDVQCIRRFYDTGKPMYTVKDLEDLEDEIPKEHEKWPDRIKIKDIVRKEWTIKLNYPNTKDYKSFHLGPAPVQNLLDPTRLDNGRQIHWFPVPHSFPIRIGLQKPATGIFNFEGLKKEFDHHKMVWDSTSACEKVIKRLKDNSKVIKNIEVDKIICFGLGSLEASNSVTELEKSLGVENIERRAIYQHAAALTMKKALKEITGKDVELCTQDPAYTQASKDVLQDYGFHVQDPGAGTKAFLEPKHRSLVYSVSSGIAVKQIVAELALENPSMRPAMMVWDRFDKEAAELTNLQVGLDPDSPRTRDLLKSYTRTDFPVKPDNSVDFPVDSESRVDNYFGYLEICIRNQHGASSQQEKVETLD